MKKGSKKSNIVERKLWDFLIISTPLNDGDCFQLLISFLYLRRMDCLLRPYYKNIRNAFAHSFVDDNAISNMTDGLTYYNISGSSLDDILSSDNDIVYLFDSWIDGFDPETRRILAGLSFEKNIASIKKKNLLREVIRILCTIDLRTELSLEFIRNLFSFTNGSYNSQFLSPESFGKCISTFLFRDSNSKDGISIYDPVCGSTLMLQEVEMEAGKKLFTENVECFGSELNYNTYSLSKALCVLSGKSYYHLKCVNSLREGFNGYHFDYIIADLPVGIRMSSEEVKEVEIIKPYYDYGIASRNLPETYFLQMIMRLLNWNGRAAVITSGRLLLDSQSEMLRAWLLSKDYIEAIVRLPIDKMYSGVEKYAWILAKEKSEKLRDQIRLVDMQSERDSMQVVLSNIDLLFDNFSENKGMEKYFHVCKLGDFSKYNVHLLNKKTGRNIEVNIPVDDDYEYELERQGFVTTDEGGDWKVLFEKTTKSYSIPFKQYFEKNTDLNKESNIIYSEIISDLSDIASSMSTIADTDFPKRKELDDTLESSWAGDVPSYWKPISIQDIFECSSAYVGDKPVEGGKFPLVNVRYLRGYGEKVDYTDPNNKSVIVEKDDLIIIKSGANAGEVLNAKHGVLGNSLLRMRFKSLSSDFVNIQFAKYILIALSQHFKSLNNGTSIGFVKVKDINSTIIYLPTMEEQQKIIDFLMPVCNRIEGVQSALGVEIPKLKKFQDTLIFDAVTGKLDI